MSKIDLQPEHLRRLLGVILNIIPNVQVLAYGSRIQGRSHSGSDLDLALRADVALDASQMALLMRQIDALNLPFVVDLRDWVALPASFQSEILKSHVVL